LPGKVEKQRRGQAREFGAIAGDFDFGLNGDLR
jgi:hypothetical protein